MYRPNTDDMACEWAWDGCALIALHFCLYRHSHVRSGKAQFATDFGDGRPRSSLSPSPRVESRLFLSFFPVLRNRVMGSRPEGKLERSSRGQHAHRPRVRGCRRGIYGLFKTGQFKTSFRSVQWKRFGATSV